jgi:hypothetical protein
MEIVFLQQAEIHFGKKQQKIFDCLKGSQKLLQRFKHKILNSMKNLFLSLAFMLIVSFAFANNSTQSNSSNFKLESFEDYSNFRTEINKDLIGTCYMTISAYDEDGNKIKSWVLQFNNVDSAEDCDEIADMVAQALSSL